MTSPAPPETVVVGRVVKPHGIGGELVVDPLSDLPERFAPGGTLELAELSGRRSTARIVSCRPHRRGLLVGLAGIDDRDRAETLRGALFEVAADSSPPPPEGAFYYYQLVGCRCRDRASGDLGRVEEVVEDGGGLLLRAVGPEGELLVPFVEAFLIEVDLESRELLFELPEGLVETCRSGS